MARMLASFDSTMLYLKADVPTPCSAIAVIVHGLCEHQGRYEYLSRRFCENGIGTYRFDHRGHGRSEGEQTYFNEYTEMVEDLNAVVDTAIAENPGLPLFIVGHSMGGLCATLFGVKYPNKVRGIVLSGALTHDYIGAIAGVPAGLDPHMELPNELGDGVCSVPLVVQEYYDDPYNAKTFTTGLCYAITAGVNYLMEHLTLFEYPVLVLHGERDALVSFQDSYSLFAKISSPDRQLKIYGGLYHEIFNEHNRDEVIDDAVRWILERR